MKLDSRSIKSPHPISSLFISGHLLSLQNGHRYTRMNTDQPAGHKEQPQSDHSVRTSIKSPLSVFICVHQWPIPEPVKWPQINADKHRAARGRNQTGAFAPGVPTRSRWSLESAQQDDLFTVSSTDRTPYPQPRFMVTVFNSV